jgi:hypothetical protein
MYPAEQEPHRAWPSLNAPSLTPKFLRYAERHARELGALEDCAAFDEAAAAFPNPTPLVAATCVAGRRTAAEWRQE